MWKPRGYQVKELGDLVQMDTLDVWLLPGVGLKHFTARDVVLPRKDGGPKGLPAFPYQGGPVSLIYWTSTRN